MAEKLSVTIELLGGKEVEQQLAEIGQTGTKAFNDIQNAANKAGGWGKLDPTDLTQKLGDLGISGEAAIDKIQNAVKRAALLEGLAQNIKSVETAFGRLDSAADRFANKLARSIGPLGVFAKALGPTGIAVGVLGTVFVKSLFSAADAINAISTSAAKLDLTFEQLDKLRAGFERAGISSEAMTEGLTLIKQRIEQRMADFGIPLKATAAQIQQFIENAIAELSRLPEGTKQTERAIELLGERLGIELVAAIRTGSAALIDFRNTTGTLTRDQQIAAAQQEQAINRVHAAWVRFQASISQPIVVPAIAFFTTELPKFSADLAKFTADIQTFKNLISEPFNLANWEALGTALKNAVSFDLSNAPILNFFTSTLPTAINNTIDSLLRYLGVAEQLGGTPLPGGAPIGGPGGGIGHAAGGGLIGGYGTGTSDSNLAWVSRGEHIMPARAVAQPGVLAFLEALRRSGGSLTRVLDGMGRFALGGLVRAPIPAFAGGGLVGGMSNVSIHFPGLPPISGLRASSAVVDELRSAAALAQVRSGGRKPSRYS